MRMNPPSRDILRLAGLVMDGWQERTWTVQGFGMVRTYLDDAKEWRLNIWDDALKVPNVSEIHDHPWSFTSWVLCGRIANTRFHIHGNPDGDEAISLPFQHIQIVTGEGGGPVSAPGMVHLTASPPETYEAGEGYRQDKAEIHITKARPGTVTLNQRTPATPEHTANIYWPRGPWVDAEPRPATKSEVFNAVQLAQRQAQLRRVFA